MLRIDAPLPLEPELARCRGVEVVFDLEAEGARELLRAFANDEVVIGQISDCFRNERWCAHALDRRHRTRALARTVHDGGIELHDAIRIPECAVADPRLE